MKFKIFGRRRRVFSQLGVFLLSAIFHEYVITLAFGFFYPVLCIMFGLIGCKWTLLKLDKINFKIFYFKTVLFMFWKPSRNSNFWNFVLWFSLTIGLGCLMCLYSIEWYARMNCKPSFVSFELNESYLI